MHELARAADARVRLAGIAAAGVEVVEVTLFPADLVGSVGTNLLMEDLDAEISENALGLAAGLVFSQLLADIENVLCQEHDRDAATAAGLLKEMIPPGDEILPFVLPQEDGIGRSESLLRSHTL